MIFQACLDSCPAMGCLVCHAPAARFLLQGRIFYQNFTCELCPALAEQRAAAFGMEVIACKRDPTTPMPEYISRTYGTAQLQEFLEVLFKLQHEPCIPIPWLMAITYQQLFIG